MDSWKRSKRPDSMFSFFLSFVLFYYGYFNRITSFVMKSNPLSFWPSSFVGRMTKKRTIYIYTLFQRKDLIIRPNIYGDTAFHNAARNADSSILELYHTYGADVNIRNHIGDAPLHWAASCGSSRNVITLLKLGADPHARDNDGKSAAEVARGNCDQLILQAQRTKRPISRK
eukprot:TRINITY_DN2640_c0_g3_i1.p1 TRINITY_DN2640_c0_g3~~TRINITY_DN2640_c0_g3_i1.p1  ORF type:complete len:172 (-),score=20.77 TRINITY_DN2640_c0_g3_i1:143-658(-)